MVPTLDTNLWIVKTETNNVSSFSIVNFHKLWSIIFSILLLFVISLMVKDKQNKF